MKLTVTAREKLGRKAKKLYEEGKIPAVAYGPEYKSTNITVDRKKFHKLLVKAGYAQLFDLEFEKDTNKALIKEVQIHPVTGEYMHVSFYVVDMKQTIETDIPVEVVGVAPAVKNAIGLLEIPLNTIRIRCLPGDLPSEFKVDVSELAEIGQNITIADLNLSDKLELAGDLTNETSIAFITAPQKIEIVEEEPETDEEGEEGEEGTEGEEGAEGEGAEGEGSEGEGKGAGTEGAKAEGDGAKAG